MAPEEFDLTAIVPVVDRLPELRACLRALSTQELRAREVIVVDQGGLARAEAEGAGARWLPSDRRGLSLARNLGISAAKGAWLFFPDDDCVAEPRFLAELARWTREHPGEDFACGRVLTPAGTPLQVGMGTCALPLADPLTVLRTVLSTALVVRRAAVARVVPFDERFGVGARWPSGEESDLVLRLLAAGSRGRYLPGAVVRHPDPVGSRSSTEQCARAYEYGRGWGALFAAHANEPGCSGLQRRYLVRALGGTVVGALSGDLARARRSWASFRGRVAGWREYRSTGPQA